MFNIAVAEILRKHGKWADSRKLVELIGKGRSVGERQAYNILKRATDKNSKQFEKEIIRHVFSDRTVIYGLPEFGPPILEKANGKTPANLGFWGWWETRAERRRLEKKDNEERRDKHIKELEAEIACERAILREEMQLDENDPHYLEKVSEIEYKWRKKYGLI